METGPEFRPEPVEENNLCFGCGKDNPIGMKLQFTWDGQTARAEFKPAPVYQGWPGFLHGGITACMLDEAMGWAAMSAGAENVTAKMQVRYRRMAPLKQTYLVKCTVTKKTSRLIETEAFLTDKDGTVFAEATSTQFVMRLRDKGCQ
jgi:acyl-coenzyme A thioesterase PaaI-like protein